MLKSMGVLQSKCSKTAHWSICLIHFLIMSFVIIDLFSLSLTFILLFFLLPLYIQGQCTAYVLLSAKRQFFHGVQRPLPFFIFIFFIFSASINPDHKAFVSH